MQRNASGSLDRRRLLAVLSSLATFVTNIPGQYSHFRSHIPDRFPIVCLLAPWIDNRFAHNFAGGPGSSGWRQVAGHLVPC